MPLSRVTRPLRSPRLKSFFSVVRRKEIIGSNGRISIVPITFRNVSGVVNSGSQNSLNRDTDSDYNARSLSIVTTFKIQGVTVGNKPDLIVWKGGTYLVNSVDNYPQYGEGFYQVECQSIDMPDLDIDQSSEYLVGQVDFSFSDNSNLIGIL